MKRNSIAALSVLFLAAVYLSAADAPRDWKSGTLLESEKQEVPQGSTKTSNTEGTVKNKNTKADYSQTTTTTTTENYDTFQVYTIHGDAKTYIARERLLFPWSKPANVTVGDKIKYSVQKNTLFLLDDDGKQHKAGISKVKLNQPHEP
jgi:hypothetical protein